MGKKGRAHRQRPKAALESENRTNRDALAVSDLFANTIAEIVHLGQEADVSAAVDIEISFKSVSLDRKSPVLSVFVGKDSEESSTSIKLATRVYIEGRPSRE